MSEWWKNLNQKVENFIKKVEEEEKEYQKSKKQVEQMKKEIAEHFKDTMEELRKEEEEKRREILVPLENLNKKELIKLFKEYLRIDEFHAEEVGIIYSCLKEEEREEFLNEFTEEECEVIKFHYENLKVYSERIIKETVNSIVIDNDKEKRK